MKASSALWEQFFGLPCPAFPPLSSQGVPTEPTCRLRHCIRSPPSAFGKRGAGGGFFPARWLMGHWSPGRRSQESLWQQLAPLPHKAPPQGDGGQLAWQPCSGQRHFVAETTMLSQNSRGVQRRLGTPALTVKTGEIAGSPPSVFERLDTGGSPQVHRERRVSYLQLRGAPFITNQQQVALAVHNNLLLEPATCEGRP